MTWEIAKTVFVLAATLVLLFGWWPGFKRAFRCGQSGCSGTMEPLGQHDLDAYLEDTADSRPLPDDTVMVPSVPEVLMCNACGEYVERRG